MDFSVCTNDSSSSSPHGRGSPEFSPSPMLRNGRKVSDILDCLSVSHRFEVHLHFNNLWLVDNFFVVAEVCFFVVGHCV